MRTQNTRPLSRKGGLSLAVLRWAIVSSICVITYLMPEIRAQSGITREVFLNIGGTAISDLTNSPAYPNSPDSTNIVTDFFESPTDVFDNYGQRMYGYIVPPVTGNYTFWIASEDR